MVQAQVTTFSFTSTKGATPGLVTSISDLNGPVLGVSLQKISRTNIETKYDVFITHESTGGPIQVDFFNGEITIEEGTNLNNTILGIPTNGAILFIETRFLERNGTKRTYDTLVLALRS